MSRQHTASVREWLVGPGLSTAELTTSGHGETRPVADNATAAGRQQNRRVEVVIERARG